MKLRNGKEYNFFPIKIVVLPSKKTPKKIKTTPKVLNKCSICSVPYKEKDLLVSCCKFNKLSHNFHIDCLKEHIIARYAMKHDRVINKVVPNSLFECPYCLKFTMFKNVVKFTY